MESMEYNLSMKMSEIKHDVMVYETESISGNNVKLYKTRQDEYDTENDDKLKLFFSCEFIFERGDSSTKRYIQNDELKYSLRSLEKNAPWIRCSKDFTVIIIGVRPFLASFYMRYRGKLFDKKKVF